MNNAEDEEKVNLLAADVTKAVDDGIGKEAGKEELGIVSAGCSVEESAAAARGPVGNPMCGTLTSALGVMGVLMLGTAIVLMGLVLLGI